MWLFQGAPIAIVVTYYLAVAVELGYVFWKKLHVQVRFSIGMQEMFLLD
jgi:hypothetical protein